MQQLILNLHGLGTPHPGVDGDERRYWWGRSAFCALLDRVTESSPPDLSIGITFDDGNLSDVEIALPELQKRGMRASFFIVAGRMGKRNYLSTADIRRLVEAGMEVGSHGMAHRDWRRASDAELEDEIVKAPKILEDACGVAVDTVGVPFGSYDRRVLRRLRAAGVRRVYTSDRGFARPGAWLAARETLDARWMGRDVLAVLGRRATPATRMLRLGKQIYKRLR